MVHVYVAPGWRGASLGEELVRRSMGSLGKLGLSHALTLADDKGSGQLTAMYEGLGFVGAPDTVQDNAMLARMP